MVNIWEYANDLPRIRLRTNEGEVYIGDIRMIWDAEELEADEDCITLDLPGGEVRSFRQSEIEAIERL